MLATPFPRSRTSLPRRRALGRAAAALLALAGLAAAGPALSLSPVPAGDRSGSLLQVAVVDRASGRPLPVWAHRGERYVAGTPGAAYAIRVTNPTPRRLLAVMSVDGVNVITGQTAGLAQSGYVLDPGQSADITGWRKSESQVAAFEFTALSGSYAALTGRPAHVGVIGVAVFTEREPAPRSPELAAAPAARAAQEADAATSRRERLGTGHGAIESSWSSTTHFERASTRPAEVVAIRYDSHERLAAAGVIPRRHEPEPRPLPFPLAQPGFVADPPVR